MQETETDERWYVQFDSGQVQLMTLEELDTAFEAGEVHENTFVIQVGETQWQTLADVAGLSDEEDSGEPRLEPKVEPEPTTLYTPAHAASLQAALHAPPRRRAAASGRSPIRSSSAFPRQRVTSSRPDALRASGYSQQLPACSRDQSAGGGPELPPRGR